MAYCRLGELAVRLALALLAILPYLPVLSGDFVWDDRFHIVGNQQIATLSAAFASLGSPQGIYHRPLLFLGYAVEKALFGESAFGFHLTNLLLHGLNTVLLFNAGRRTGLPRAAEGVAGCFSIRHPRYHELLPGRTGRKSRASVDNWRRLRRLPAWRGDAI